MFFPYISSGPRIWDSGFEKLSFHVSLGRGIWDLGLEISLSSLQNTGFGIRDFSCLFRAQDLGFRMRDSLSSIQGTGFGIWDSAYCLFIYLLWTQDLGFKIHINTLGQYTRFGIRDFRSLFFIYLLKDRIWDLKHRLVIYFFRAQDLGFEILSP